jgi:hypothetical protein
MELKMRRVVTGVSGVLQDTGTPPAAVDVNITFNGYQNGGAVTVGRSFPVANPHFPASYDILGVLDSNYQGGLPAEDYDSIAEVSLNVPFVAADFETTNFLHTVQLPIEQVPSNMDFRIIVISNFDE